VGDRKRGKGEREREGGRETGGGREEGPSRRHHHLPLRTDSPGPDSDGWRDARRELKPLLASSSVEVFAHRPVCEPVQCFLDTCGNANTSTENPANTGSQKPRRLVVFHSICPPLSSSPHALLCHSYGPGSCHSHQ